ncbi:MAG: hypothetical protein U5N26_09020 [Candidatus Marinimicrobia bacterium]|nr:hypothetical protein [Candidatus Neomarinimicrobiota bacterium]
MVADTEKGFGNQDGRIVQEIYEQRKGLVLAMNKWDLMEKETNTARDHTRELIYAFPVLANTPVIYVSALKKQRLLRLLDEAIAVNERMQQRIPTSKLNHFFLDIIRHNPPPAVKGKYIRIKYATQILENPPLIGFFCNEPKLVMDNYRKFLEAAFRKHYDFRGVPLHFVFKTK